MNQGTVKFFNKIKNFGFIKPDENGDDIFFHINDVNDGLKVLQEGQKVTYKVEKDTKSNKNKAVNVSVI